uniref:NADH-ubiquinone oxidoreductase chain 2 n=1 Tax=Cryptolestes pusillus TaxID=1173686 RepID=A0A0U2HSH4_9CUCU|nr:NADH dehydrogenase subunit 2 [Cryptolestes pusillus]ALI87003.1 NADH dehydrogenase subunit 2 [Cryptolestes pusillus]
MVKYYKLLFFNTMIAGTFITISAYSWFSMWLGLEINLLSIIPLLNSTKNSFPSESALKYFITQSMASTVILFAILFFFNNFEIFKFEFSLIMNSAILTKMGAAPFHFWFPEIVEGLSWFNNFLILTWQKIAPMILIFYFFEMNYFFFNHYYCFFKNWKIPRALSNKTTMNFSLFINMSHWLAPFKMTFSLSIWTIYFTIYTLILSALTFFFNKFQMYYIFQMINFSNTNKITNLSIFMILFSLGGLPPFLGFMPKWLIINSLISNNLYLLSSILILFTLVTLFYYIRLAFSALVNNFDTFTLPRPKMQFSIWILNSINFTGLAWCTWLCLNF